MLFVGSSHNNRADGTFNNPNQLGYWALIAYSVWLVTKRDEPIGLVDAIAAAIVIFLVLESQSKAALVGVAMLIVSALFFQRMKSSYMLGAICCGRRRHFSCIDDAGISECHGAIRRWLLQRRVWL